MGKQGKRKQRQKRKQQQEHRNDELSSKPAVNPSSAIHQLRHPDPKIRQNALISLQANILHNSSKQRISVAVLQAIREQVMDSNFECASAAADCLAHYMSFPSNMEHQAVTTASWTPIFISRLGQCLKAIQGDKKKWKQWYAVAAPCTKALCKLVENNERAIEQIVSTTAQMDAFLSTILGLLHITTTYEVSTDNRFNDWVEETAIYAARILHSSLDENPDLTDKINASSQYTSTDAWVQLLTKLPALSKIHICGSLVNMFQASPAPWQNSLIIEHVIQILSGGLLAVQPEQLQVLEQNYVQAVSLRKSQKEDEELEGEIVRKIGERKEPARIIARRQKEVERGSKAIIEETKDGEQAIDEAISAWSSTILPLQVTLEVIANLSSCFVQGDDEMEHDGPNHDRSVHQALVSMRMAESLMKALQALCAFQSSRVDVSKEQEALSDDLQECTSKCAACIANCVLCQILEPTNHEATWQVLCPLALFASVSSILVVLTQCGLPLPTHDVGVVQQLLRSSIEDSQRDGVSLLAVILNDSKASTQVVLEATQELLTVLNQGESLAKVEALNVIMDLWGQDDYHPDIFSSQKILPSFQATLASLSTNKNLDPEAEEVLFNAGRFVDYKLGR